MTRRAFTVTRADGTVLEGWRRPSVDAPTVVLLHAGVTDGRCWEDVGALLDGEVDVVAFDRRGYGGRRAAPGPFTHVDDLLAVLDAAGADRAVLVGNSMGGGVALDTALLHPHRVASLLLIGSAVTGMTDEGEAVAWSPDGPTGAILGPLEAAERSGDVDEQVRLSLHLWLDGPAQPEGRVGGAARALAADMHRRILTAGTNGDAGLPDADTWHRLAEIAAPALVTWGEHDLAPDEPFARLLAERLPRAEARVLPGVAHLPSLERPDLVADLVREAVRLAGQSE